MAQYSYDDTGAIFSYFLVALLSIILIPTTLSLLTTRGKDQISCICDNCVLNKQHIKKIEKRSYFKIILVIFGWLMFSVVLQQAFLLKEKESELWDPYKILGIDPDAGEDVIRKAFKKASLKFHPDKVKQEDKEEAEKMFIDISKAHKVLTDEEARKLYEEFGHPDGKQAFQLGLALPSWLVEEENRVVVMFIYAICLGFGLPYIVVKLLIRLNGGNLPKLRAETKF